MLLAIPVVYLCARGNLTRVIGVENGSLCVIKSPEPGLMQCIGKVTLKFPVELELLAPLY